MVTSTWLDSVDNVVSLLTTWTPIRRRHSHNQWFKQQNNNTTISGETLDIIYPEVDMGKYPLTRLDSVDHIHVNSKRNHECEQCDRGLQEAIVIKSTLISLDSSR